jgi:single-strand DNA-binding protein
MIMGRSVNQVILMGRLTRDVELKPTTTGKSVASFTLAVDSQSEGKDANFFDVTAWEKLAELVNQYTHKGSKVLVMGRLQQQTWSDKDSGQKRSKVVIIATDVTFLDSKPADTNTASQNGSQKKADDVGDDPINIEDIPF